MAIRVSLIEDDAQIQQLLVEWLRKAKDLEFVRAYSNAELAMADLALKAVDVVLCDINLPGTNGIECVRQLKVLVPQTNFVMLTVHHDPEKIFQALAAGATGYLLKRTTREELLAAIAEVHGGGSPMSSSIARLVVDAMRSSPAKADELEQLTIREKEVLRLLARGFLYKEISDELSVSYNTVHTFVRRIYDKLHVHTRSQAVDRFIQSCRAPSGKPPQ